MKIDDVPNLRLFYYCSAERLSNPLPFKTDSLAKVTDLWLGDMIMFDTFFDMIKLKFPFLESLTVRTVCSSQERFNITCFSLKRLKLSLLERTQVNLQVYAPSLLFFYCESETVPILSFLAINPEQIELKLFLRDPIDCSFFLNMRKLALTLSSKFDIDIRSAYSAVPVRSNINFDDLKRDPLPSTNLQNISLHLYSDSRYFEDHSEIFDGFFLICHPSYIVAYRDRPFKENKLYKQMVRWMVDGGKENLGLERC